VSFGPPNPFPIPLTKPDYSQGVGVNLYNNIWGTNYIMHYPYLAGEQNSKFRFRLTFNQRP